jgi:hypothetical protein
MTGPSSVSQWAAAKPYIPKVSAVATAATKNIRIQTDFFFMVTSFMR